MLTGMRLLQFSVVLLGTMMVSACATNRSVDPRARWQKAALQDYTFSVDSSSTVTTSCTMYYPARISIRAGKVSRVVSLNDQHPNFEVPSMCFKYFYTVDGVLNYIDHHQQAHAHCIKVTYDPALGYPSSLIDTCILDGEFPVKIWDLHKG
jgi:hypothetical protein